MQKNRQILSHENESFGVFQTLISKFITVTRRGLPACFIEQKPSDERIGPCALLDEPF